MDTQVQKLLGELKKKDKSTYEHSFRVADLIHKYSAATNLGIELTQRLIFCAELHDIGKLILPNRILKKAGPLTDSEWKAVKEHPRLGSELIRQTFGCERLWESCIVMTHHERMDGHGYPVWTAGRRNSIGSPYYRCGRCRRCHAARQGISETDVIRGVQA